MQRDRVADFRHHLRVARAIMPARRKRSKLPRKVPPRSVALSYYRAIAPILEAARQAAERALDLLLPALEAQAAEIRADAGNINDVIDAVGKEFFDKLRPSEIEALAERFARATSEWEKEQAAKQTRAAFGVDVLGREPNIAAKSSAFVSENVALIKSIPSQYFDDLEKRVARAVARGATPKELAAEIKKAHGVADDRAMTIARTQIGQYYGQVAQARQKAMGVTKYVWRTSNDERVREEHAAREGEVFAWDDPPEDGAPGAAINCFPGDTVLTPSSGVQKLYRRWTTDNLTEVVTADGMVLRATRNHPVLTTSGWKRAEDLDVGDYLIKAPAKISEILVEDLQGAQAMFVETFDAAEYLWFVRSATSGSRGFHGDAVDEEIDVVDVDWKLGLELDALLTERVCYDALALADKPALRLGSLAQLFDASLLATHRGVRGGCKLLSLMLAECGMAREHSLAAIAWRDAAADQLAVDGRTADAEAIRKLFDGVSFGEESHRLVARIVARIVGRSMMQPASLLTSRAQLDTKGVRVDEEQARHLGESGSSGHQLSRVVEKRVSELVWSGHVYNLQSPSQQYIAQGVIVHNCRCYAEPVLDQLLDGDEPHAAEIASREAGASDGDRATMDTPVGTPVRYEPQDIPDDPRLPKIAFGVIESRTPKQVRIRRENGALITLPVSNLRVHVASKEADAAARAAHAAEAERLSLEALAREQEREAARLRKK